MLWYEGQGLLVVCPICSHLDSKQATLLTLARDLRWWHISMVVVRDKKRMVSVTHIAVDGKFTTPVKTLGQTPQSQPRPKVAYEGSSAEVERVAF